MPSLRNSGKIIGSPVSVRELAQSCPDDPLGQSFSLRELIAAPSCPFEACVRLHFKVLTAPATTMDAMLESMRVVYATAGIRVELASMETLSGPSFAALTDLDVGQCSGALTLEQLDLFSNRNNAGDDDIVVYFINSTVPANNGCATHPDPWPGAVVASQASIWTLAHEVGHVLKLNHITGEGGTACTSPDFTRLMTGCSTSNIVGTPTLSEREIRKMNRSKLVIEG